MAFQYLTNIPLDQAREEYRAWMAEGGFAAGAEEVPAGESWGRTTARAVYAGISAPHYLASAMDGIALETPAPCGRQICKRGAPPQTTGCRQYGTGTK